MKSVNAGRKSAGVLFVAARYLRGRGGSRTLASAALGVALSLVPLIAVLQVADGMIEGITRRFIETGSYHLSLLPRNGQEHAAVDSVADLVSGTQGVKSVTVERRGLSLLSSEVGRMGVTVRALNADVYERDPGFREFLQLSDGRFWLDEEGIVVSTEVARRLEVGVDDELRLLTLRTVGGRTLPPRVTRLTVRGVVSSGYQELDRLWVFINLETGRRVLPVSDARQIVGIKIDEPFGLDNPLFQNADPIRAVFEASASTDPGEIRADIRRSIGSDWFVLSWYEADRSQYISFTTTKNLLVFIMVLIVGVAALNISSSVVMLVLERRQDIAILRSTGTDAGQIVSTFTLSGFLVGALGTAVGLGLGLVVAANINEVLQGIEIVGDIVARLLRLAVSPFVETPATDFVLFDPEFYLEQIPVRINLTQLVIVATLSLLLSTLASFVPAWKAGQIKPLELLRKH